MDSSTPIDRLNNKFLFSITRSEVFANLPLPICAQISKELLDNGAGKLATDCCRFCGIKLDFKVSKIQIIKRRWRRNKSPKIKVICQGCQKLAMNPIKLPSLVSSDKKDESTLKKTTDVPPSLRSAPIEIVKKSNKNSSSKILNVSQSNQVSKGVTRRTSKVNKLHLLASKNSKPICNSLSSFLKSFQ
uniref:Uncharacterized protein n=1 Tax=Meloidogyne floridensis TaxID=298350 RepID=A0A915NS25_9BILA